MALFKKNKDQEDVKVEKDSKNESSLKEEISDAYDDIMNNRRDNKPEEPAAEQNTQGEADFENVIFKANVKKFVENKTQENLLAVLKMLPGRKFLLPSASNMEDPFEKVGNELKLKEGAVINPALLTAKDEKVFLPIFTDENEMTQKSPSGVILKFNFEQCVSIVYNEQNPVWAVVINPFTDNMIIGNDLLRMVFKEKKKEA